MFLYSGRTPLRKQDSPCKAEKTASIVLRHPRYDPRDCATLPVMGEWQSTADSAVSLIVTFRRHVLPTFVIVAVYPISSPAPAIPSPPGSSVPSRAANGVFDARQAHVLYEHEVREPRQGPLQALASALYEISRTNHISLNQGDCRYANASLCRSASNTGWPCAMKASSAARSPFELQRTLNPVGDQGHAKITWGRIYL